MTPTVLVDCGSCRACCHQTVRLIEGQDDPRDYDQANGVLRQRPDGACIYLDDQTGCTIYERRPAMCRMFDCGAWYSKLWMGKYTRNERRQRLKSSKGAPMFMQMIASGKARSG